MFASIHNTSFLRATLFFLSCSGFAEAQAIRSHNLQEAIDLLEKQGSLWKILAEEQTEAQAEGAGQLSFRNPEVSYAREDLSDGEAKVREWNFGLRKDFSSPGVYFNRRAAERHRSEALKSEFDRKRAEARGQVREAYLEAALKREETQALLSLTGIVDTMVKAGQARFEEQDITSMEMFRLSSAQARVREIEAGSRNEYHRLTRRLAAWLYPEGGILEVEPADTPEIRSIAMDSARLMLDLEKRGPDLKILESRVREAEAALRESRHGLFPEVSVTGGWKSQSDGLAGPALEISAPIPILNANGAGRSLRNAKVRRAKLELDQAKRMLRDDLELSLERLRTLEERIQEYEALLRKHPFASMTTALVAAYTEGRNPAFEVLDGLFGLHESLTGYHRALLEREKVAIHIQILAGGTTP